MSFEVGTKLYRYTIKNNKFHIHEGIVNQCVNRKVVVFPSGGFNHSSVRCPRETDIGAIRHIGLTLWLDKRDDELAKKIFVDYEEQQIRKLEKQLADKREIVKMMRGE